MKKLLYLTTLFIITICLTACDGRDRLSMTPQEVLKEHKLLDSFSEKQIRFIPEDYAEKTTDTIFDNGYEVHVKMYSDMNNHITVNSNGETVNYRDFNLDIKVIRDDKSILSIKINKGVSIVYEHLSRLNLDEYYLRDFWIAKDNKYYPNMPAVYFEYYSPVLKDSSILEITPKENKGFLVTELIN
ncbi:hypothetical protein [Hanstruepera flava]|uniref:hypothetical protein n=1 Tax=Hanstruepera flava TaxID=2930218 RepID=UPI00202916A2|nr:hypothetical protein [Hanstruepera flava]